VARRRWSFFLPPLEHGFIRRLDDVYRCRLTSAGRALVWALVAAAVLRLGALSPPLYVALGLLASTGIVAVVMGLAFRPNVTLSRRLPPPPSAGDVWHYDVQIENTSRRLVRDLRVEERRLPATLRPAGKPVVVPVLAPGERATVRVSLSCVRRGAYTLGHLQAASSFPLGLLKLGRVQPVSDRLLVYPAFTRLTEFAVPVGKAYQPGGIPVASRIGESMELAGLRDWRDGDRPRDVHWPAFARTGRLVVRERMEEHFTRLALVLDIEISRWADAPVFERGLSAAAAIADALARRDHIIDIFAAGETVYRFQAGRALAHVENILDLLACLEPGSHLDVDALAAEILPLSRRLSAVIVVLTCWDEVRAGVIDLLRAQGLTVRVLCVRPDTPITGLPPHLVVTL